MTTRTPPALTPRTPLRPADGRQPVEQV